MRARTAVQSAALGLVAAVGVAANVLHGRDRSLEFYSHERTARSERIVYKVHRWFMDPMYDITEYVPLNDLMDEQWAKVSSGIEGLEGITLPHLAPDAPLLVQERRFDPTYIHPQFFDRTDPSYELLPE